MNSFEEMGLHTELLDAIKALGFETPTPIQAETIPQLLSSEHDLIATAQTGTGKTAAFGLPAIHLADLYEKHTQTLVLCPTRELCLQIAKDMESYAKFTKGIHIVAVYGGSSISTQIRQLNRGSQVVVATPGRAKDLIERGKLKLDQVERVILDEADEMLTMGFKDELEAILAHTPDDKQTLLFSATMSREIKSITKKYMKDPLIISVARQNVGAQNVQHVSYQVSARDKYEVLKRIADMNPDIYGIVFCRTRQETKDIANKLIQDGYNADALHGDLSQAQRDEAMNHFRKRNLQLLVATDVASRGLDVDDLTHVINYQLPDKAEVYTHRSGRTGRAGKKGISIAILHSRERRKIMEIERFSNITFTQEPVPTGKEICEKQLFVLIDKIKNVQVDETQIEPFLPEIYEKLEGMDREELIKHFVSMEFNRFLDYYKNARDLNVKPPREKTGRKDRRDRHERSDRYDRDDNRGGDNERQGRFKGKERKMDGFTHLSVNVGKKNKMTPLRLLGMINDTLDHGGAEIGKIKLLDRSSIFEIEPKVASQLIESMAGRNVDGVSLEVGYAQKDDVESYFSGGGFSPRKGKPKGKRDNFNRFKDKKRGKGGKKKW